MNMAERLERRRRLVLAALVDGPLETSAVARLVGGHFHDVLGVLDDLRLAGEVELVDESAGRWQLRGPKHAGDDLGGVVSDVCHEPDIGTSGPVHNPVDSDVDKRFSAVLPTLSTGPARVIDNVMNRREAAPRAPSGHLSTGKPGDNYHHQGDS